MKTLGFILLVSIAAAFGASETLAQTDILKHQSAPVVAQPSTVPPPVPAAAASTPAQQSSIPRLPVSNACKTADVNGLWKLQRVYEEPVDGETTASNVSPVQYLWYKTDGTYGKLNAGTTTLLPKAAMDQISQHAAGLQQYLVQDTYYYQDRVANEVQACFIVFRASGPFAQGEMLLMPPKGTIKGRLIKQYTKVWPVQNPAVTNAKNSAPNMRSPVTNQNQRQQPAAAPDVVYVPPAPSRTN